MSSSHPRQDFTIFPLLLSRQNCIVMVEHSLTFVSAESGYNWADSFRNRAERRSSIASSPGNSPNLNHNRAKSVATMQPPTVKEVHHNVPDHFQERILKGDFYMD